MKGLDLSIQVFLSVIELFASSTFEGPGSDSVMDENGNPFPLRNGPSGGHMSTTAQQPTRTSPQSSTVTNALANKSSRSKKKGKDGDGVFSEQMPGFLGDRVTFNLLFLQTNLERFFAKC